MIEPQKALELILKYTPVLPAEMVSLTNSVERVLAENIYARNDLPPFHNSAMDGFAVRSRDWPQNREEGSIVLKVIKSVRAGDDANISVRPGEAVKIMTGAPIPRGADAVVMKERTEIVGENKVRILHPPKPQDHFRKKGEDVRSRALILKKGSLVRPYEVALLAAQGIEKLYVVKRPQAAVLATGDELLKVSDSLREGKIRNSNGPSIASALQRWRIDAHDLGIARDEPAAILNLLRKAIKKADILLISGGVSVGDFDYTRSLFKQLKVKEIFWKTAIKPGKPLLFGLYTHRCNNRKVKKPIFGLPGNPVSALVCLEEFVRPALEKLRGFVPIYPSYHLRGKVSNEYHKSAERQQYLFCRVSSGHDGFKIHIIRPQGSAMMGMACRANALGILPIGVGRIKQGESLSFRWLK